MIFVLEVDIEVHLYFFDGPIPLGPILDAEVLSEQGAMQAVDEASGLGPSDLGGTVFDALQLEEELMGATIRRAIELTVLSARIVVTGSLWLAKVGGMSALGMWTAVAGSLLVESRSHA